MTEYRTANLLRVRRPGKSGFELLSPIADSISKNIGCTVSGNVLTLSDGVKVEFRYDRTNLFVTVFCEAFVDLGKVKGYWRLLLADGIKNVGGIAESDLKSDNAAIRIVELIAKIMPEAEICTGHVSYICDGGGHH